MPDTAEQLVELLADFSKKEDLIPALQAAQELIGYLPAETLQAVADRLRIPESTVFGVASFYSQFYLTRQGRHRIQVCCGTACHVRGSAAILRRIEKELGINVGETTPDYEFTLERVACFGSCALAPVVVIDRDVHGKMTPEEAIRLIGGLK